MEIICLLLCTLSLTAARVYPRTGVNDDLNGVEGVVYDISEYENPEVGLFELMTRGIMPVFTVRGAVKDSKDLSNKNDTLHYQTDDIKKALDTVIIQLQEAKSKLESGNNAIYLDIEKLLLSFEILKHHLYNDLHNASTDRPSNYEVSTPQPLIYEVSTRQPLIYEVSTHQPLIDEVSTPQPLMEEVSTPQPLIDEVSTHRHLINNVPTEWLPVNDATTEQPIVIHEKVFAYIPAAEFSSHREEGIDDVSSTEADKAEEGDKTLIRKKWSYKLSSLF